MKNKYPYQIIFFQDGKLYVATRLYPKTGVTIKPEFLTVAQKYFESDVQAIDYNNPTNAAKIINTYVEGKTNNKIHDLVDPGEFKRKNIYKFKHMVNLNFSILINLGKPL